MKTARGSRKAITLKPDAAPIPLRPAKDRRRAKRPDADGEEARERFARTFADVLSGRFGGNWAVEWEGADHPASPSSDRDAGKPGRRESR